MSDLEPAVDVDLDEDDFIEPSTMVKVAAPFLALGAAFVVRKVMDSAYEKATGRRPPSAGDHTNSIGRVLMYAAATAAAVAVVNVIIDRATAPRPRGTL
jgi:hypothetical protein